jgi:hypothetical protein
MTLERCLLCLKGCVLVAAASVAGLFLAQWAIKGMENGAPNDSQT